MPVDNFKRINLDLLYPEFMKRILDCIARCEARGAHYIATCGFRSPEDQTALWMLGRQAPGRKRTNAKAWESQHQYGLAVDFIPIVAGKVSWAPEDFRVLIEEAEADSMLHSGSDYNDSPHVGWFRYINAQDLAPLRKIAQTDGVNAVWALIDSEKV